MKKRTQYNEAYGFMPKSLIARLPVEVRTELISGALCRKATPAGQFIALAVVTALGEPFIRYMVESTVEALGSDGTKYTEQDVMDILGETMESFAQDSNVLMEYVNDYAEATGNSFELNWDKMADLAKTVKDINQKSHSSSGSVKS